MIKIIDNCCSPAYLDILKNVASNSDNWNLRWPANTSIDDKFLKLDIVQNLQILNPVLAGLATGLLLQIYETIDKGLFIPEIFLCGISIKDKRTSTNIHKDQEDKNLVKILGILNSDWEEEWGGRFFHDGTSNYIKPTSFCIFDPSEDHAAEEILTDKKRFAIDFTVFQDQQSFEKVIKIENK